MRQPAPDSRAPTREVLRARRTRSHRDGAHGRQHVPAGIGADRCRTQGGGRVPLRPAGRHARSAVDRRQLHREAGAASGLGARRGMERVGRGRCEHAIPAGSQSRSQRGVGAAIEVEVGVRLPRRQQRAIAAGGARRPRLRRQRKRRRRRPRREARMSVPGAITRRPASAPAVSVGPYKTAAASGFAVYFADGSRDRVRGRCEHRPRDLAAQG